jgi:uncharacterized protein with HEPN domain
MRGVRKGADYIADMLENAQKARKFVGEMEFEEFVRDEKTQYAVLRALEVLGEAAKKVPIEWREAYSEVPWQVIAGMRDKLIHDYAGVNMAVVWRTVKEDLPPLIEQLRRMLKGLTDEE